MGAEASFVNQDLVAPAHPVVAIDKRLCHDRAISMLIPQDILHHPSHGAIYEVGKGEFGQHGVGKHGVTQDLTGHNTTGHNTTGHGMTGHNTTGHGMTGHNTTGHGMTGHNTTGHNVTGHNATEGGVMHNLGEKLTGHHDTHHNTTGHNVTGHNTTGQGAVQNLGDKLTGHHTTQPASVHHPTQTAPHGAGQGVFGQNEIRQNELPQDAMHQQTHGLGGHNMLGKDRKGQLMFDFASLGIKDKDDRVLKDSNGKPIVYLTEKNRVIMRNFAITRDSDGYDKIFDVKRKHLSKSPVRAEFKDLASGRTCRLGAAVMEEAHGITALLWLDNGDGTKQKIPVGRIHLPTGSSAHPNVTQATDNHHKVTDAVRPVEHQHKDHGDGYGKDYQLDLMPGVDSGLAALVGMVTIACADHKRRHGDSDTAAVTPTPVVPHNM
ncbi:hypothetical protein Poli38472_010016 [Pythium oligandrum]|uniref:Uncharacterized protein n=1 Tax=Pythium oligandrum TaxID=41045 RepID=A0A8K1FG89_PYTOL|nr:hypothetical protein Poli38472_010016 [Pythium oligandrum]|eukprot:TMW58457.1 hypothetical protein Poli38472_010016 [Pythium oligandrum]